MTQPARAPKKKGSPSVVSLSPRTLSFLLAALGLALGGTVSLNAYQDYAAKAQEVASLEQEVASLRVQAEAVERLRLEVAALEEQLKRTVWAPRPEAGGIVWLTGVLARKKISARSVSVGREESMGEVTRIPVSVNVEKAEYASLVEALPELRARRVRLEGAKLAADGEGGLSGALTFGFFRPTEGASEGGQR